MAKSIVQALTSQDLADLFRNESSINNDGSVTFTRRGVSRLVGLSHPSILRILKNIESNSETLKASEYLQPYMGQVFEGGTLPEEFVYDLISFYAESQDIQHSAANLRCSKLLRLVGRVGFRQSVHIANGWRSDRSATQQLAWKYILDEPRKWSAQFPDSYYNELARLTNIHPKGSQRPHYWANLTNEFVYGYLPKEVEDGVRQAKLANATNDKLHQFLKPDGLEMLQNHLNALMVLMSSVSAIDDLRKLVRGRFSGSYQLALKLD